MSYSEDYIDRLQASGRICFSTDEYIRALGLSEIAARHSLNRLRGKRCIASPVRGFHVVLGPADRAHGSRPPEDFIDSLMQYLEQPYYVALLSAAEVYGAAHHRPQQFQVMVKRNRRSVSFGRVRLQFVARVNLKKLPTVKHKVRTGYMVVSTPEVTALDLVCYHVHAAGLDNVATILGELAESLSAEKLYRVSSLYEISIVQRLGYILEHIGQGRCAKNLDRMVSRRATRAALLLPGKKDASNSRIDEKWRIIVNEQLEPDL